MFEIPLVTGWFQRLLASSAPAVLSLRATGRQGAAEAAAAFSPARRFSRPAPPKPLLSVIILNFNGALWLERCLQSLRGQALAEEIEVLVADSASADGSAELAAGLMRSWPGTHLLRLGTNLGYSGGNNLAAAQARGQYLLFLNHDTWLEPGCLDRLVTEAQAAGAAVATPLVLDYDNGAVQSTGAGGFDLFGLTSRVPNHSRSAGDICRQRLWFSHRGGLVSQSGRIRRPIFHVCR